MSEFIGVKECAAKLGVAISRVTVLCRQGRIAGAQKIGRDWIIPSEPKVTAGSRSRPGKLEVQKG